MHIWDQNNFAGFTSDPEKPFNGSIPAKLVIMTLFYREGVFKACSSSK